MADEIAGHYCGQQQPHDAHTWQTPPAYGSATFISVYQCAGRSGHPDCADADRVADEQIDGLAHALRETSKVVERVRNLVHSCEAEQYRDEAASSHPVEQPYADNRYVRLVDAVRQAVSGG